MRRTTLGGLSASQLNARPALGGSRLGEASKGAPLPPPAPRAERSAGDLGAAAGSSFGGRASLRRTSVFSNSGSALRQDPRPLSDKAFVEGCAQALIAYLATHGYERPLSPKLLSSNKEFAAVVAFLARRVDPGAPPLGPRVEEEVPALFKRLRYPFAIPKSALQAVGSPHTWPALLAALAWLVQLLRYEETAAAASGPGGSRGFGAATERGFFDFCAGSYGAYLAGDDARVAALDEALEAAHGEADAAARADAARQQAANAALDSQLDTARAAAVPLDDLVAKKAALEGDALRLAALSGTAQTHVAALRQKLADRRADACTAESELSAARAEAAALAAAVASQRVSAADVAAMAADRAAAEAQLAAVRAATAAAEDAAREAAASAERRAEEVVAALRDYDAAGVALKVLPAGAKRGKGGAFAALQALQPHAAPAAALAAAAETLRTGVRPGLEALRDDYRARWRDAGAARLRLDAELDASEAALAQRRDDRAALEAEVARAEAAIADAKERVRDAVAAAEAQAAALEAEAEAVRAGSEARVHGSEAELSALRASYDELAAACASEAAHTQQTLLAALDSLMIHKQAVQDALGRCAAVLAALGDDLGADVTGFHWKQQSC